MSGVEVSARLTRWIEGRFPPGSAERVLAELRDLPDGVLGGHDVERVQASLVIRSNGDWLAFQQRVALAYMDWRDSLVGADLGDEDWRDRLDAALGTDQ